MPKKSVKMTIPENGYKKFRSFMKKMDFKNEDLFLRYCFIKAIKPKLTKSQQKLAQRELKLLKEAQKRF